MTNSRVDMASFVDPQKVIARNAFSAFQSAWNGWNGVESPSATKSESLKCQLPYVEKNFHLQ
jgi:hypothetical protein